MDRQRVKVLDHGYLEVVESWGSDERIVEAARMSTGKGFLGWGPKNPTCSKCGAAVGDRYSGDPLKRTTCEHAWAGEPGDEKLLRYLWENKHHTPFEMAGMTFEVMAPIFVFREWHRHRVPFSYNEMSARYTPLPDVNYVPSIERLMQGAPRKCPFCDGRGTTLAAAADSDSSLTCDACKGSGKLADRNRQAGTVKDAATIDESIALQYLHALQKSYAEAEALYQAALKGGVPKELARIHLPVGRYSRMRASANLRGWLAFVTLRSATSAQWEIRQYSDAVRGALEELFPRTLSLFRETFSKEQVS